MGTVTLLSLLDLFGMFEAVLNREVILLTWHGLCRNEYKFASSIFCVMFYALTQQA